jgi:hypothetical protein
MALTVTMRRLGDITRQTEGVIKAGKQAHTTEVRRTTTLIQNAQRRVVRAKLGPKLANTVRSETFPASGIAANPKGRVFSKAIYKRPGGLVDLLTVFREGAVIHARSGGFLAVGARKVGNLVGRGIRKVREVRIVPRIQALDTEYERIAARLPEAVANTYDRLLERLAR